MEHGVLFVSPHRADAATIGRMLAGMPVRLEHAADLKDARVLLARSETSVVLTEAQLPDGNWVDVLNLTYELPVTPAVIVTHRLADDRFWAEVLNMGAYDLLAQPFDPGEVQRIIVHACSQAAGKRICPQPAAKTARPPLWAGR